MTFVATSWAISYVGARPVFVDVDPVTYTMDLRQVERKITRRTRAILPVHLYGQPADMGPLLEIGRRRGIPVIEDAAQAHGARYDGQGAGTLGLCGCFSFYPGQEPRCLRRGRRGRTDDEPIAERLRSLRDHAQSRRYHHAELGFNYRMDGFQGAVLGVKLKYLDRWTEARRRLADRYREKLCRAAAEAARRGPRAKARLAPVRRAASPSRPHPPRAGGQGHPDRPALPRAGPSPGGLRRSRASAGRLPDRRAGRPAIASPCPSSPR